MARANSLRVAVIGGGNMGKNHVRNYAVLPESQLVGLADINPATEALAKEYKAAYFQDYKQMLDHLQPEAVSIVVPTPLHAEVATEVMRRGIHCLLEKPIASTVQEADALIALAKKQGVVFTVGHIEHYNPVVRKLKAMIDAGKVGEVTSIVCKRVGGFPAVEPKTDVIIDLAVHDVGILSYLLGRYPEQIYSHGSRTLHSKKIDAAEILLSYGRASGFIQVNWLTPVKIRTIAITGSTGYVEANYITQELDHYKNNMQVSNDFSNFLVQMGEPEKQIIKVDFEEPLAVELKAFISAVRGEKQHYVVQPVEAREALRLALDAVKPYEKES